MTTWPVVVELAPGYTLSNEKSIDQKTIIGGIQQRFRANIAPSPGMLDTAAAKRPGAVTENATWSYDPPLEALARNGFMTSRQLT